MAHCAKKIVAMPLILLLIHDYIYCPASAGLIEFFAKNNDNRAMVPHFCA